MTSTVVHTVPDEIPREFFSSISENCRVFGYRFGMFGSHLSIAGGLYRAAVEAERLGLETVQIFTKNRPWQH